MATEEVIKALRLMEDVESIVATYGPGEARSGTTVRELKEACRVAIAALRAQQRRPLDRSRWEGCGLCVPGKSYLRFCGGRYCKSCGRPLTGEAWADLERRIGGKAI